MSGPIHLTHCTLHLDRHEVEARTGLVRLTATESELLDYMVAHTGRTISKEELLRNVWHYAPGVQSRAPDHTINRLRAKIEGDPKAPDHLNTVYGVGYRLDLPDMEEPPGQILSTLPTLPAPAKPLRGREVELGEVRALLEEGVRWVTVVGPGGMGKTHLVREIAAGKTALWCDLRAAITAAEAVGVVGQALGVQPDSSVVASAAMGAPQVVQALEAVAPEILVLDNLEQVDPDGIRCMAGWLDALEGLQIVATSRVPLRFDHEQILRLGPLRADVADALFRERARTVLGTDQAWEASEVADLMDQLDGMPLAIELAAGRMGVLGPADLRERLVSDVGVLGGGQEAHHRTVLHTLERSWTLLTPAEQEALAQCTVFRRPFDTAAVEAVVSLSEPAPPVLSVLSQLVDASMLRRVEGSGPRFDFFVLTRAFVEDQKSDLGEALARHLAHFHRVAGASLTQHRSAEAIEVRTRMAPLIPDLLAATEVAQAVDAHAFTELLLSLDPFIGREIPVERTADFVEAAVALSEGMHALEDRCQALRIRGRMHFLMGRWEASSADLERAIALALEADEAGLAAMLEVQLASQLIPRGALDRAQEVLERAVGHAQAAEEHWVHGRALFQRGRCLVNAHQEDQAQGYLLQALAIQREVGDRVGVSRTTAFLGRIEANAGRMAQAELHFRDALHSYRGQPIPGHLSWIICSRSEVYCRWGRLDKAEALARDAIALTQVRGTPGERAVAEFNMGMIMLETGRADTAEAHLEQSRRTVESLGFRRFLGDVLEGLGCAHFDRGDLAMAEATWDQAVPVFEETSNHKAERFVQGMRGMVALVRGNLDRAATSLQQVIDLPAIEPRSRLLFRVALAIVYADQGEDGPAHLQLEAALGLDPGNQIDVAAMRALAEQLDAWLASGRSAETMQALVKQVEQCRAPAGTDLCPAVECSTNLRWMISALEQHLIGE